MRSQRVAVRVGVVAVCLRVYVYTYLYMRLRTAAWVDGGACLMLATPTTTTIPKRCPSVLHT